MVFREMGNVRMHVLVTVHLSLSLNLCTCRCHELMVNRHYPIEIVYGGRMFRTTVIRKKEARVNNKSANEISSEATSQTFGTQKKNGSENGQNSKTQSDLSHMSELAFSNSVGG